MDMMKNAFLLLVVVMVTGRSMNADAARSCLDNEFLCTDGKMCIPKSWRCDGEGDCSDSSDEQLCNNKNSTQSTDTTGSCLESEFPCTDGQCIHKSWWCDGDEDCTDSSDEKFCNSKQNDSTQSTVAENVKTTTLKPQGPTVDPSCQRISSSLNGCNLLGYMYTRLPNGLGQADQNKISQDFAAWREVIRKNCSPMLEDFLCRAYTPPCDKDQPRLPCRSMCNKIKKACRRVMRRLKIRWPSSLRCSKLPKKRCYDAVDTTSPPKTVKTAEVQFKKDSFRGTRSCQKLKIAMCQGLNYNTTVFPNLLNHRTQDEAGQEIHQFLPLVQIGCSEALKMFLCSVYVPICTVLEIPLPPCRSLCEQSKSGCSVIMARFGFVWPSQLKCSNFPKFGGDQLCIAQNISETTTDVPEMTTNVPETTTNPPETKTTQVKQKPTIKTTTSPPQTYCGGILTDAEGDFTSPNYPYPYPLEINCQWTIQLPDSYNLIKITIEKMRLEEDRNCFYDYIIVKDKMLNQVGRRHCGTYRQPYEVPVRGNEAIITFVSDSSTRKGGFSIKYKGLRIS